MWMKAVVQDVTILHWWEDWSACSWAPAHEGAACCNPVAQLLTVSLHVLKIFVAFSHCNKIVTEEVFDWVQPLKRDSPAAYIFAHRRL
jgi:hypothetical protein